MSCFGAMEYEDNEPHSLCKDCGAGVDEDGVSVSICVYSPVSCQTCGDAPCDKSC